MVRAKTKNKRILPKALIATAVVVCLVVAGVLWHARGNTKAKNTADTTHSSTTASGAQTSSSSNEHKLNPDVPTPTPNADVPSGSTNSTPITSSTPPDVPSGTFVSNHHTSMSGANQETSECITTAGATCDIQFSYNGVTKSLGVKTVDSTGAASWAWTPEDVGLSPGTWKITAVATLNGQTKTTTDQLQLEVSQ